MTPGTRLRIFISGPFTGNPDLNVSKALDAANALLARGLAPYVPHLSHFWDQHSPKPYETWMELDFEWLSCCHAVLRLPGESAGTNRECELAQRLGIRVFASAAELEAEFADRPASTARGGE